MGTKKKVKSPARRLLEEAWIMLGELEWLEDDISDMVLPAGLREAQRTFFSCRKLGIREQIKKEKELLYSVILSLREKAGSLGG